MQAPIGFIHIAHTPLPDRGPASAWRRLQAAIGDGLATAILGTPETRGSRPGCLDFRAHRSAPPRDAAAARTGFNDLLGEWRFAFETVMNRRWSLCDNPYAKAWIMPGMILLHEDPLGFAIDNNAASIARGEPLEEPVWAILTPKPESSHAVLAATAATALPHAAILDRALTRAAREEGHGALCPLRWAPKATPPDALDIVEA